MADLRLAQALAIHHNAEVAVSFDTVSNRYSVEPRSGSVIDLPEPRLGHVKGTVYTIDFDEFCEATIGGAMTRDSEQLVTEVVFQPTGGTEPGRTEDTVIWIAENGTSGVRFVRLRVSWVTGEIWHGGPWVWDSSARNRLIAGNP